MLYLKCKMRNVISHFAFQILPFGFVAMAYGIPNLVLAGDIVKIVDVDEFERKLFYIKDD